MEDVEASWSSCLPRQGRRYLLFVQICEPPRPSPAYIKGVMNPGSAFAATRSFVQLGWSSLLRKSAASPSGRVFVGAALILGVGREPAPAAQPQPHHRSPHFCGSETGLVFTCILSVLVLTRVEAPWGAHPAPNPLLLPAAAASAVPGEHG